MRIVSRVVGEDGILAEACCPLLVKDGTPREDVPEGVACQGGGVMLPVDEVA